MVYFKGHHGTSSENAKKIRESNFLLRDGWFGRGAYFFDDDIERARNWARDKKIFNGKRIEVIECDITVDEEKLLDLSDPKSNNNKQFHLFRNSLLDRAKNLATFNETKESLDCKVINYLIKKNEIDVVRSASYTYTKLDRQNKMLGSNIPNAFEICVVNLNCIEIKK
ncbi:hypothetical protein [Clostridium perfringens]|uniref:hypothetical protein n=1 Tax=Clostridium perfringens TaxID=1502 RepID=UPI0024BD54C2|nr:hypothetical protein [Clostridium perfringens]